MDSKRLRYFLAVAEEQHFHAAAERLHIVQSALSRQIQALEQEIGFRLFDRHSRGTRLTQAGQVFRDEVAGALHAFEHAVARGQAFARGKTEELSICIHKVSGRNPKVVAILKEFRRRHPAVRMSVSFLHSEQQLESIYKSELDLGFMFHAPADRHLLAWHRVDVDSYELILPDDHRLAAERRIAIDMLRDEQFIIQSRSLNRYYYDLVFGRMLSRGVSPSIAQEASSETALIALVAMGLGISFVHGSNRLRQIAGVRIRPLDDLSVKLDLKAVWKRKTRSPPTLAMAELVREMVAAT